MKQEQNILVGISIGDLNGIGPEVVLKSLEDPTILELFTPIIFANVKLLSFLKKTWHLNQNYNGIEQLNQVILGKINVLNVWKHHFEHKFGELDSEAGKLSIASFKEATKALKANQIDILVTAPIHKHNIQSEDFKFAGHTGYLNQTLDGNALMLLISEDLRVGLMTEHIALAEVSKHLTKEMVTQKILDLKSTLQKDFGISHPKIAVLGLNPHCGDNGIIGHEDNTIIKPAVEALFNQGTMVFGPYAADGFFGQKTYQKFDAVLACYHDQGLIPFKTISFGNGVNFTAGLSAIRTSPDHGTGFDIAGKNLANHQSFLQAIYLGVDIYKSRHQYLELSANPLIVTEKKPDSKKFQTVPAGAW